MRRLLAIVTVLGTLCGHHDAAAAGPSPEEAIQEAKALQQAADSLQGAWITTDDLIARAEAALAQGHRGKALALAHRAKKEARLAHQQAEEQQRHWSPPPYLKK